MSKKGRKSIVNYSINKYARGYITGTLIIGRDHPMFGHGPEKFNKLFGTSPITLTSRGNANNSGVYKKRFQNSHYFAVQQATYESIMSIEDFRTEVLRRRYLLIEEYIKAKRGINEEGDKGDKMVC